MFGQKPKNYHNIQQYDLKMCIEEREGRWVRREEKI